MKTLTRLFVGSISAYLFNFWLFFLAQPKLVHDFLGPTWYGRCLVAAILLSWISVILVSWKGYERFGWKGLTDAFLLGLILVLVVHLATETHYQESISFVLFGLFLIGSLVGNAILGIMFSLGLGLLESTPSKS